MKTLNNITIRLWIVRPEQDHHTIDQMRTIAQKGIYEPAFSIGQEMILNMEARFDATDAVACQNAAQYARQAAQLYVRHTAPGAKTFKMEVFMNGIQKTSMQ